MKTPKTTTAPAKAAPQATITVPTTSPASARPEQAKSSSMSLETAVAVALVGGLFAQWLSHRFTRGRDRRKERIDAFDRLTLACAASKQTVDRLTTSPGPDEFRDAVTEVENCMLEMDAAVASFRSRSGVKDKALLAFGGAQVDLFHILEKARIERDKTWNGRRARKEAKEWSREFTRSIDQAIASGALQIMRPTDRWVTKRDAKKQRKRLIASIDAGVRGATEAGSSATPAQQSNAE